MKPSFGTAGLPSFFAVASRSPPASLARERREWDSWFAPETSTMMSMRWVAIASSREGEMVPRMGITSEAAKALLFSGVRARPKTRWLPLRMRDWESAWPM